MSSKLTHGLKSYFACSVGSCKSVSVNGAHDGTPAEEMGKDAKVLTF
jgi:hypothetical protein